MPRRAGVRAQSRPPSATPASRVQGAVCGVFIHSEQAAFVRLDGGAAQCGTRPHCQEQAPAHSSGSLALCPKGCSFPDRKGIIFYRLLCKDLLLREKGGGSPPGAVHSVSTGDTPPMGWPSCLWTSAGFYQVRWRWAGGHREQQPWQDHAGGDPESPVSVP